ncbi:hypothetical protein BDW59DRAFT_145300 [Aspergillus cavernicola]|uniref:Uncharacterized protein n=1 Tax=Aspergillus cavernicola TaxID=176166 RepID=A0ABR4IFJ4_9EURO
MTIVNMNPHMTFPHHQSTHPTQPAQPAHPGERPPISHNPSGPMNHDHIVNQMNHLHIRQDSISSSNEATVADIVASADVNEETGTCYVGYTFFKAQPRPGSIASWKRVDKSRMNLRQDDLSTLVRKKAKRIPVGTQYQSLSAVKRPHVDRMIEELRQNNPRFHWTCAYVKEDMRDLKGKNFQRGDYETTSMDIILMGKLVNRSPPRDHIPIQTQHSLPEHGPTSRPFSRIGPYPDPWGGPSYYQPSMPPQVHNLQQGPIPIHQHGPSPSHPQLQHVTGPQYPQQGPWEQNVAGDHPPLPVTVMQGYINQAPNPNPRHDVKDHGVRGATVNPEPQSHRQETPRRSTSRNHQTKAGRERGSSPKQPRGSEPELVYDSTSSGDDDMLVPDHGGEDSEAEFSERNNKSSRTPLPWRGSLYRGYPPSQPRHRYRTHHRKEPQRLDDRGFNRDRENATVDLIPGSGKHVARHSSRIHHGGRQHTSQPNIIHQQTSSSDLDVLLNHFGGRAHNDIRSRMLTNWEADLEERERQYHKHMLQEQVRNDRMDEVGFLSHSRSLREPMPAYPRGYLTHPLHYV